MEVVSLCALRASGFEWRPAAGTVALTVVCKATYLLRPERAVLASAQEDLASRDEHWNGDLTRSLRAASDLAPYKPRADVVLVGHAYAPAQKPVRSFVVRVVVGELDKSIEVWCERSIRWQDGRLLEGPRIVKTSLCWENAAGGPDSDNPVGMRLDGPPDRYGMLAVPAMQPPDSYVTGRGDTFAPIGYGPVAPHWPARTRSLHRYAGHFPADGWQSQSLPADFNYAYFNVAPRDQQVTALRADERLILENLHPDHPRLVTTLPGTRPRAIADRATGEREEIPLVADTLWIDTDRGICTLVWRGRLGLRHAGERGRVAFWVDGQPTAATVDRTGKGEPTFPDKTNSDEMSDAITMIPGPSAAMVQTLPLPDTSILAPAPPHNATQTLHMARTPARDPLPFNTSGDAASLLAASSTSPWAKSVPAADDDGTGTVVVGLVPNGQAADAAVLPFHKEGPTAPPRAEPAPSPPAAAPRLAPHVLTAIGSQQATAPWNLATPIQTKVVPAEPTSDDFSPPPLTTGLAPPPMIGPLATPDMVVPDDVTIPPASGDNTHDVGIGQTPKPTPPDKIFKPEDFALERWAALTASIALHKPDRKRLLDEQELSFTHWAEIEKYWNKAIREEIRKGRTTLLKRSDSTYLARIEEERGPITSDEYAMLVVATERGATHEMLDELRLPQGALLRIERVWAARITREPGCGELVAQSIRTYRNG